MTSRHPRVMILYHPMVEECLANEPPAIVRKLMAQGSDLRIRNMLTFLPVDAGESEINRWYNLPYDRHPSSYGLEVYAKSVKQRIRELLEREKSGSTRRVASADRTSEVV